MGKNKFAADDGGMEILMKRESGVLLHISSLPGKYGCGSFGDGARAFVDVLAEGGFTYWQTLPFCVPDSYFSPYSSASAFSGNPYFVDLGILYENGLLTKTEILLSEERSPYVCEFSRLTRERMPLLFRAAERALKDSDIASAVDAFMLENPRVAEFCRFMAMREANGNRPWHDWTIDVSDAKTEAGWRFIEYEFFRQWADIKEYANGKGIKIIGDIPFYVSLDSSDVWGSREQFLLDSDGRPEWVAGVPPDYFSEDGQLWGNPLYNWDYMKNDGYSFWRERMQFMLTLFDGVRIDHFRAIESYYSIPGEAISAKNGEWRPGPRMELIDVIKETAKEKLIIAEDLGDITDEVRDMLEESGFPGMRVMQFGFLDDSDSLHRPHNYVENCVAYTGTHDNNTLLGSIWEMPPERRADLFDYCGCPEDWSAACLDVIRSVMASKASIVILPIQDILGYGADTRMNKPGVADDNWNYRITSDQLRLVDTGFYRRINHIYGRLPK